MPYPRDGDLPRGRPFGSFSSVLSVLLRGICSRLLCCHSPLVHHCWLGSRQSGGGPPPNLGGLAGRPPVHRGGLGGWRSGSGPPPHLGGLDGRPPVHRGGLGGWRSCGGAPPHRGGLDGRRSGAGPPPHLGGLDGRRSGAGPPPHLGGLDGRRSGGRPPPHLGGLVGRPPVHRGGLGGWSSGGRPPVLLIGLGRLPPGSGCPPLAPCCSGLGGGGGQQHWHWQWSRWGATAATHCATRWRSRLRCSLRRAVLSNRFMRVMVVAGGSGSRPFVGNRRPEESDRSRQRQPAVPAGGSRCPPPRDPPASGARAAAAGWPGGVREGRRDGGKKRGRHKPAGGSRKPAGGSR